VIHHPDIADECSLRIGPAIAEFTRKAAATAAERGWNFTPNAPSTAALAPDVEARPGIVNRLAVVPQPCRLRAGRVVGVQIRTVVGRIGTDDIVREAVTVRIVAQSLRVGESGGVVQHVRVAVEGLNVGS